MRKGLLGCAAACSALLGAACAVVAPRPRSEGRQRAWEYLRHFRYAHRGLYDPALGIPENSLSAFERAATLGFGSELDVHVTADGQLVVLHDSNIERMTGEQGIVERMTYEELSKLRLSGTGERIPLFSQVLDAYERIAPQLPLVVEIKTYDGNHAALTAAVMEELDRHVLPYCVESFDPRAVMWLRRNRPDVFRGQLSQNFCAEGQHSGKGLLIDVTATMLAGNVAARPDFVAFQWQDARMPQVLLATKVLGAAYAGWTLRSPDELLACEGRGGIGIFERFVPQAGSSAYSND